jgi:prophage regulatory protein
MRPLLQKEEPMKTEINETFLADDLAMLRFSEVLALTGFCRSQIYKLIARGEFPHPISLGRRAIGWIRAEVVLWLAERVRASRNI